MNNLKEWLFEEQRKKYKFWSQNIFRPNKTEFEKQSLEKVYGKLQQIDATLKFLGVSKKDRYAYGEINNKDGDDNASA